MKIVSKTALQASMLEYFQAVEATGEDLVVTSENRPVLKIVPFRQGLTVDEAFADVYGKIRYHGDLLESTADEWETS
jgi:antitoxin (DNA-binding transcriptional repressor) of toxin-antitoxin stability system